MLIELGCIDSLHETVAEKEEYIDGDVLTVISVDVLKALEGSSSITRTMKLQTVVDKVKQAVREGISQETMDRLSRNYAERLEKKNKPQVKASTDKSGK